MGMFDVDYNNVGPGPVQPGYYEVYVSDYQLSTSRSGNPIVSLFYTIREDINQPNQGSKIQYDNFNVIPSSKWRMDAFAKAVAIPNGTPINSAQEWAQMMVNKDLIVRVIMGSPNQSGRSYPEVNEFHPTQMPSQGRPMPVLEKAYGNQNNGNNQNQQGSYGGQQGNGYGNNNPSTYGGGASGGYSPNNNSSPAVNTVPHNNFGRDAALDQAANRVSNSQQSLGMDPVRDNRSFANGGFKGADISDDDLPF